jgi:NADH-quinone oxidoreductase subunit L
MIELLSWVPLFPLSGFLILAFGGSYVPKPLIAWIGVGSVAVSAILTALAGAGFLNAGIPFYRIDLGYWIAVEDLSVAIGFYLDALSLTMLFVVTGVGLLIHLYAAGFMDNDPAYARFFAYMNLFVFAMLVLVLADNLVLLYLGWEGVGLGSYLLIGFWYRDAQNGYAARKAFVMTRIGDMALLIGVLLLFTHLRTFDIQDLMIRAGSRWTAGDALPIIAASLLLGGALGKSAQLPLQTWLPDAMAGPTPVSALIHAATMVTAGVYLIARTNVLFSLAPPVQSAVAVIGTVTLLMAGCSALTQTDIKRILAYSTISQIGYMFLALGVGAWSAAIFHLLTHAFFKALLFLAAGAVIYCFHHEHNIFKMGGLARPMPLVLLSFLIGSAALSALPFTSGYYSKHEILSAVYSVSPGLWAAACIGAIITGIYSFRPVFVVFFGSQPQAVDKNLDWRMTMPLIVLGVLSLVGGMLQIPLDSALPAAFIPDGGFSLVLVVTIAAPFIGLLIAMLFYLDGGYSAQHIVDVGWMNRVRMFWFGGWGIDWVYDVFVVRPFKRVAKANKSDAVDYLYAAVTRLSGAGHRVTGMFQNGSIRWYASSVALGAVLIIAIGWLS